MIAVYARVSTEEQAKKGFSLADQIRAGKRKAGTDNVLEYVDEGVSGELLDRPALTKLRRDVKEGIVHQVICLDPDRLSRKLINQLIISEEVEAHATLVFVNGDYARTPEGQLFYQMRGAISQFEKAKIAERMSRGRREKARQGRVLRDFHIYGYDYDKEREQFVVNRQESAVVLMVFDLFTNPRGRVKGINGIAEFLNRNGIASKHGGVFHRQVVRQMLMNRAYIGEFYQNKWNSEGTFANRYKPKERRISQRLRPQDEWIQLPVPAIIDEETFLLAEQLLEQSRRRFAGRSRHTYLLSGLLRCDKCNNTLTGQKQNNWGKETFVYTDRKRTAGAKNPGCGTVVSCAQVDKAVLDGLFKWFQPPSESELLKWLTNRNGDLEEQQMEQIDFELQRIDVGMKRLTRMLGSDLTDENLLQEQFREYGAKRQRLLQERSNLVETYRKRDTSEASISVEDVNRCLGQIQSKEGDAPVKLLQDLIRTVVREIIVMADNDEVVIYTY